MNTNYEFKIGDLVYVIRKLNGLTQVELSKKLGVVQSTISKVEKDFFDDVPFSLVSKISLSFGVPLNYFQIGLLPINDESILRKGVPTQYIEKGSIGAKTVFFILEELSKIRGPHIYKEIKIPRQFFSLSTLQFNEHFLKTLSNKYGDDLVKAIQNIKSAGTEEVSEGAVERYIAAHPSLKIIDKQPKRAKVNYTLEIMLEDMADENFMNLYRQVLVSELKVLFADRFNMDKSKRKKSNIFELEMVNA